MQKLPLNGDSAEVLQGAASRATRGGVRGRRPTSQPSDLRGIWRYFRFLNILYPILEFSCCFIKQFQEETALKLRGEGELERFGQESKVEGGKKKKGRV